MGDIPVDLVFKVAVRKGSCLSAKVRLDNLKVLGFREGCKEGLSRTCPGLQCGQYTEFCGSTQ